VKTRSELRPHRRVASTLAPLCSSAALALALLGTIATVAPASSAQPNAAAVNQDGTYGPFATMRRAEEVAQGFRQRGCRAIAFHNGDGYYVGVSC
jgi:hypothetical protein